jgi:hypothetical protein
VKTEDCGNTYAYNLSHQNSADLFNRCLSFLFRSLSLIFRLLLSVVTISIYSLLGGREAGGKVWEAAEGSVRLVVGR